MLDVLRNWLARIFVNEEAILILLLIGVSIGLVVVLGDVLAPAIASIVLAFVMQGLINRLVRWRVPEWLATMVAYILFVSFFLAIILIVLPLIWEQTVGLVNELPRMIAKLQQTLLLLPEQYPGLIKEAQIEDLVSALTSEIGSVGQRVLTFSLASLLGFFELLIYLILVPLLVFFFLKDRQLIFDWLGGFLPSKRPLMRQVWLETNIQAANYVRGKFIEIVIVGSTSYIVFVLLDLKYAALLALAVGLSVIIPYIGAVVVTAPVLLVGYIQWGWGADFAYLFMAYLVIQGLDGNVLVPLLFSEAVNMHPVAIILSVLLFGGLWGLWGVFFAIPLATLIKSLLNAWPKRVGLRAD